MATLLNAAAPVLATTPPQPDDARRCANAFVLTQVTDQYSAKGAGMHEAYEFVQGQPAPRLVHRMALPALLGNAVYLCEMRLMAAVVSDPRLKPYGRLDSDEVRPDRLQLPAPTWWQRTMDQLPGGRQRRLPAEAPAQALALLQFGRLIGNTDMHFGNLRLLVASPEALAAGCFTLAPVYDMLSMRWRPDAATGRVDLDPFTPEPADRASPAAAVARGFWMQAEADAGISRGFRRLAAQQLGRLDAAAL